jgi:hypothetical protein
MGNVIKMPSFKKGDIKTIKLFDNGKHIVIVSREGYKIYSI